MLLQLTWYPSVVMSSSVVLVVGILLCSVAFCTDATPLAMYYKKSAADVCIRLLCSSLTLTLHTLRVNMQPMRCDA